MTNAQRHECEDIINTASKAAAAVGISPLPFSDSLPLAGIQIAMVLNLAAVFDVTITRGVASSMAGNAMSEAAGKYLVTQLTGIIPFFGSGVKAIVAADITEELGWEAAKQFDRQTA